ncbi:MAG: NAD(P)H-dependent glycerol-3-phosphate dehydrogenase [Candidatus Zixiibacteriota bacterium]
MAERVTILGAGAWGLAVSRLLDLKDCEIILWEFDTDDYHRLVTTRANPRKLPSFRLGDRVTLTDNLAESLVGAEVVVVAIAAQHVRSVIRRCRGRLGNNAIVVNLAKGIEGGSLRRMSEVIAEESGLAREHIVTVSGPSHAEEVVMDMPTTVVAASYSSELAARIQELFSVGNFRVYMSDDLIGVELGGSLKNIIAIAAGVADGLSLGDNSKGALLTRGLAEITRLGLAMGAQAETFAGLSGVGDLVTTCFSRHSRNRYVGERIGRGEKLVDILAGMSQVAEGVETTRSGRDLAHRHGVEMPITEEVYRVLFEDKDAREALGNLMGRKLRAEIWQ